MANIFSLKKPVNNDAADRIFENMGALQDCGEPLIKIHKRYFIDFWTQRKISKKAIIKLAAFIYSFKYFKTAIVIHDHYSQNYFHWLTECLPKLFLCEKDYKRCLVLLPDDYSNCEFIATTLKLLNWEFQFISKKNIVFFQTLYIPGLTCGSGGQHPDYLLPVIAGIKNTLSISLNSDSKKIFITRRGTTSRRSYPYNELEEFLSKEGYRIIEAERYSFTEQVNLFSDCLHFIALHGAGLTNIMFMPERAKVMEIRRSDDKYNYSYYLLANVCNVEYYYLLAAPLDPSKKMLADDFVVDFNQFKVAYNLFKL
ncbi:MAG: glycosyltransferase family 61 protein [Ferruginibacter sp.]|nr:glycosyltransferase family 61 protein [Ferruginibacter sp.]